MHSIGSRLVLIYVLSVAGMIAGIFFVGRHLLAAGMRDNLDTALHARFLEVRDRALAASVSGEAVAIENERLSPRYSVKVVDRWDDPAYRAAKTQGTPPPPAPPDHFFTSRGPDGSTTRVFTGTTETLVIEISTSEAPIAEALQTYTRACVALGGVVLVLSVAAGYWLSRTALRPLQAIERTAARISSDNLGERILVPPVRNELSNVARLLNHTFDRLESSFELIKQFAADASHEIKTPLSVLRLNLERMVLKGDLSDSNREALQDAVEAIHKLNQLVDNLLFLSRAEAGEAIIRKQPTDAAGFIDLFVADAEVLAEAAGVQLVVTGNQPGTLALDPTGMREVLFNVVANAIKASPPGGRIELHAGFADDRWRITVDDEGPGVPPERLTAIFGRFASRTNDPASKYPRGAGLGLAISHRIVSLLDGRIEAVNRVPRGLRIACEIPVS